MDEGKCTIQEIVEIISMEGFLYLEGCDRILFVVDEEYQGVPLEKLFSNYEYDLVRIPRVKRPGQDYELDENLLDGKTVAWLIASASISHAASTRKIIDRGGIFLISNTGFTKDWVAILDPRNRPYCQTKAEAVLQAIGGDAGGQFHITADDGTDLVLWVPDGNWQEEVGKREGLGTNGPFGELSTAPFSADGTLVVNAGDFLTNPINRLQERIQLTIVGNYVANIEGRNEQAEILKDLLDSTGDFRAYSLGEFAFGLNPGKPAKLCRSVIAEKLIGGFHIAIGSNALCLKKDCPDVHKFLHGRYSCGVHIDCIKFGATVIFQKNGGDEITILKEGAMVL